MGLFDFFKPQWKHSDPSQRAAAIRHLHDDQQNVFLEIALEDGDAANRLAAARRLSDFNALKRLRDRTQDRNLRDVAQRTLLESLSKKALTAKDDAEGLAQAKAALEELGEDHHLVEDLATEAVSVGVRRLALQKLVHPSALLKVAQNEGDAALSLEAFHRITRENHFEALAKQAKSKEVRRLAKEKLKSLEKARQPDEATINRQKLALLLSVADKAALASSEPSAHFAWDAVHTQVIDAEQGLRQLLDHGFAPPADQIGRFRDQLAVFHTRYDAHRREEDKKQARLAQALEARARKEVLCVEVESLAASASENGSDSADLRQRFEQAGHAGEAEDEMNRRFRQTFDRHERERLGKLREREEGERRRQHEIESRGRLNAMTDAAEALLAEAQKDAQNPPAKTADNSLLHATEKARDLRRDWQKYFPGPVAFEGREALAERFDSAVNGLESLLDVRRASNLERMRTLLPELETLIESSDFSLAEKRFRELNITWRGLQPLPQGPEAESLVNQWRSASDRFREAQDWLRWSNLRSKQDICTRLEALVEGEDRKSMFGQFKEMQDLWKATGPVPWDASEALWDRYHGICDKLYEKLKEYFAELDEERESHYKAKEEICAKLEAMLQGEELDWRESTDLVKEAQANWKTIGAVPKDKAEALWQRFRTATSGFYDRKDGWMGENSKKKNELVALAESLQDSTEWKTTSAAIKEAQEKWKQIGPVPKSEIETLWQRFHAACEKFFSARRANLEKLETERPINLARKQELCALVETIEELPTDQERYQRIVEAQAAWKEVGPAPRELEEALWERFRKPIDTYFQGRKARLEDEYKKRDENARIKEEICVEAESVAGSIDWKNTVELIKALQARWRTVGPAPREKDKELWNRFRTACDGFFDRLKQNAQRRDSEREGNMRKKEDLCFIVEGLIGQPATEDEQKARAAWQLEKMAEGGANGMGGMGSSARNEASSNGQRDWRSLTEEVKNLQKEWKNIGPVPKEKSEILWDRFHQACDRFFEERRRALGLREEDPQANLESKLALIESADQLATQPGEQQVPAIIQLRRQWKSIGPVPRAQSDYVWKRFNTACETAAGGAHIGDFGGHHGDPGEGGDGQGYRGQRPREDRPLPTGSR